MGRKRGGRGEGGEGVWRGEREGEWGGRGEGRGRESGEGGEREEGVWGGERRKECGRERKTKVQRACRSSEQEITSHRQCQHLTSQDRTRGREICWQHKHVNRAVRFTVMIVNILYVSVTKPQLPEL